MSAGATFGILLVAACASPTEPSADVTIPDARDWVTGEAKAALDSRGRFIFPVPAEALTGAVLTPDAAREQAAAFFRTFAFPPIVLGISLGQQLLNEHGTFDPARVRVAAPTYYAQTPYGSVSDSIPLYVKKHLGPRYISYYEYHRLILGNLASSAYNTDLRIENGRIQLPPLGGNAFRPAVIPRGELFVLPTSPEAAVALVGRVTGARVTHVPHLLLPNRQYAPQFSRWEIVLDRKVRLVGDSSGNIYATDRIYVGLGLSGQSGPSRNNELFWVPLSNQPALERIPHAPIGEESWRELEVDVIRPILFESARPAR